MEESVQASENIEMSDDIKQGLKKTAQGLMFVYLQCLFILLGFFAPFVMGLIQKGLLYIVYVTTGCFFLASILGVIGRLFCLKVPTEAKASFFITFSAIIEVVNLISKTPSYLSVLGVYIQMPIWISKLFFLSNFFLLFSAVFFLIFLRKLAKYINKNVGRATIVLFVHGIGFLFVAILSFQTLVMKILPFLFTIIANFPWLIAAIPFYIFVAFIMYANLLSYLRRSVWQHIAENTL